MVVDYLINDLNFYGDFNNYPVFCQIIYNE